MLRIVKICEAGNPPISYSGNVTKRYITEVCRSWLFGHGNPIKLIFDELILVGQSGISNGPVKSWLRWKHRGSLLMGRVLKPLRRIRARHSKRHYVPAWSHVLFQLLHLLYLESPSSHARSGKRS